MNARAPMGHNGGPALEGRRITVRTSWAKALFADPETPSYVMGMAWVIHWYSDRDGKGAAISNEQFMEICNLSRPTVTKGKLWLVEHGYLHIRVGDGRGVKSIFTMTLPEGDKEETALLHEEEAALREMALPLSAKGEISLPKGETALPKGETRLPPILDITRNITSSAPARPHETGRDFWAKHTNPHGYNPDADVRFDGHTLTLVNGLRSKWLDEFGGDDKRLNLALIEVAGQIQQNSSRALIVQVEAKLAHMAGEKLDRDQRYRAAAAKNGSAKSTPSDKDRLESLRRNI
jgi:hypothetical protein